eukprot:GFYU01000141.1.p1 GENE.GFYU01000141.1~~GFYU01000141.1.p1  ORF type:complete len:273 (+),score=51.73 GFYU01000141.1:74-892(+)
MIKAIAATGAGVVGAVLLGVPFYTRRIIPAAAQMPSTCLLNHIPPPEGSMGDKPDFVDYYKVTIPYPKMNARWKKQQHISSSLDNAISDNTARANGVGVDDSGAGTGSTDTTMQATSTPTSIIDPEVMAKALWTSPVLTLERRLMNLFRQIPLQSKEQILDSSFPVGQPIAMWSVHQRDEHGVLFGVDGGGDVRIFTYVGFEEPKDQNEITLTFGSAGFHMKGRQGSAASKAFKLLTPFHLWYSRVILQNISENLLVTLHNLNQRAEDMEGL